MTSPYRESAALLVVCRPRRTLWGRLRSWWRARLVRQRGRWRERHVRCHTCRRAFPFGHAYVPPINWSNQVWRGVDCYLCGYAKWSAAGGTGPPPLPFPPLPERVTSGTPGDRRGLNNLRAALRRSGLRLP
jgi:hypothetical protein